MIIQGLTINGGMELEAPTPTPTGPSKFVVGARYSDDPGNSGSAYVYNTDGTGEVKLTASDATASDFFGESVAITDTHVVVGAYADDNTGSNSGSVYVYNLDGTGEVKITASDAAAGDQFGYSVAATDTHVVVGAPNNDDAGISSGSVYVYNTDGTGELKITASDAAFSDLFGCSVAATNTHIVVGAYGDNSQKGAAYVYNLDGTGEVKITASDGAASDVYGISVAISDTKVIVGAYADDNTGSNSGSAYVYNLDGTGEVKITASDAATSDQFGRSVAMSDTHVVVGATGDADAGSNTGSVYVYNTDGTGEQKITASDAAANDYFGVSVAISDTKVIVGALLTDIVGSNSGCVYVYNTDGTGEQKIQASDAASDDQFGGSVAIN